MTRSSRKTPRSNKLPPRPPYTTVRMPRWALDEIKEHIRDKRMWGHRQPPDGPKGCEAWRYQGGLWCVFLRLVREHKGR